MNDIFYFGVGLFTGVFVGILIIWVMDLEIINNFQIRKRKQ